MMLMYFSAMFALMTHVKDLSTCVDRNTVDRPEQSVVESVQDWFDALLACRPQCGDSAHLFCKAQETTPANDTSDAGLTDEERELEMCIAPTDTETGPPFHLAAPTDGPSDSQDDEDCGCQG